MKGININSRRYDFCAWILARFKDIETRTAPTFRPYIGKRIGLIRTGCGQAQLVGYATVTREIIYTSEEAFKVDTARHMVRPEMRPYDFASAKHGVKYGYVLADVHRLDQPVPVTSRGIVAREVPDESQLPA